MSSSPQTICIVFNVFCLPTFHVKSRFLCTVHSLNFVYIFFILCFARSILSILCTYFAVGLVVERQQLSVDNILNLVSAWVSISLSCFLLLTCMLVSEEQNYHFYNGFEQCITCESLAKSQGTIFHDTSSSSCSSGSASC